MVEETKIEETPTGETTGETPEAKVEGAETPEAGKPAKRPWWEARIGEVTGQKKEAEARLAEANQRTQVLEAALREAQAKAKAAPEGSKAEVRAEVDVEALRTQIRQEESIRAAQQLAAAQFTETCNRIAVAGKKDFPDFDTSVKALQTAEGLTPDMVLAAAEMDNPQAIIHALGQDLEEAMRIKSLPPIKQAAAIAKLAQGLEGKPKPPAKKISGAPEPIKPITGSAKGEVALDDEATDIKGWMAQREKDLDAKRKAAGR